ncbi:MprA protease, GlyGly-CTERM protein-sorting domain-containing form [Halorubrum sp. AD140]|uniref:MprA protease, GlyGly-CTERM protein-sorting domain-containing form n=1 Tax=Halorubrum sp. AD140 TaxID=3050073 RepID=UPI002ACCBACA|nr:MprA protease, GlyGly-CTERM protein-sorting domain-containing form [Halorubrum sp. AD140]MDZ5810644.1 MprA protease, GlyGly-CTERM protein-sorting domain-containing form [Halorubrum sp. AD140]
MSHSSGSPRIDLDAAFKAFGAVGILIAVVLTVGVLAVTDPFGEYVSTSPAVYGSLLSAVLLLAVGYAAYALRRR